ncbi:IscS subfamily cysteine desulfurase [Planococcus sp. N028]|uniref:IscS subfamily cysteine desulfurase n=1 Tax=Planococcus shixiaomingii TaxID=3058393 RepID=A0ABT8MYZ8_9BACL|nr:IscS subfamily cysteine desulfurase [Planococcus sp. N028]MDN7240872.1 IscS subfamily cysteine desulfurase [Planococcus sp. N028]
MIYLDSAATVPMRKEALAAYAEAAEKAYGNTHSLHDAGSDAAGYWDSCRQLWASFLNVRPEGIYFTGNASEGNQLAIRSLLKGRPPNKRTIITTKLEHASVLTTLHELEKEDYQVEYVPVDRNGIIDIEIYKDLVDDQTALVILQLINSEMGAMQPVAACTAHAKKWAVPVHCDIVQGFGKISMDIKALDVAAAVCSAHKIGGPKGVGIVYIDPAVHWESVYEGTTHQNGFRAGTVDVPGIVSATIAAKHAVAEQQDSYRQARQLQEFLINHLPAGVALTGDVETKSPFILGLILPHVEGQWMMLQCNREQIAISTGTACKIGSGEAMSAMGAMGVETDVARKFIRISFCRLTTEKELKEFLRVVDQTLKKPALL